MRHGPRAPGLRRSAASPERCTQRLLRGWTRRGESRLLAEPLRHPPFDLFLRDDFASISGIDTALDRLLDVDVVLDLFIRDVVRKLFQQFSDLFLRLAHAEDILTPGRVGSTGSQLTAAAFDMLPR